MDRFKSGHNVSDAPQSSKQHVEKKKVFPVQVSSVCFQTRSLCVLSESLRTLQRAFPASGFQLSFPCLFARSFPVNLLCFTLLSVHVPYVR